MISFKRQHCGSVGNHSISKQFISDFLHNQLTPCINQKKRNFDPQKSIIFKVTTGVGSGLW